MTGDFTAWNTYAIEWRADFVTVSVNGAVIFDNRKSSERIAVPTVPMFSLYADDPGTRQAGAGTESGIPDQVAMYVDWDRYTS